MLTPDQIEVLQDTTAQLLDPVVEYLIREIAARVAQAGQLTATASYQVWRAQQLGVSQYEIKRRVAQLLKISQAQAEQLFRQAAEVGYRYDLERLPSRRGIPFKENTVIQQIVSASVQMAQDGLSNITQTMGFVGPDGRVEELTTAFIKACDFAHLQAATGATSFVDAVRQATAGLRKRGIQFIDYESGRSYTVEAAVRRNVWSAAGIMQEKIGRDDFEAMGADGWEISAHAASAPDHEPIQGKQYSDEAYRRLNNSLIRRIGTLNCGHTAFPIILGVTTPQYTPEELEKLREENEKGIEYNGKHYTLYEATQRQRKIERDIRETKRKILIDEATGDSQALGNDQVKYQLLRQEYKRFNDASGLRPQYERAEMAGFGPKQARASEKAYKEMLAAEKKREENLQFIANDAKMKAESGLPKKYKEPDTILQHTVEVVTSAINGVVPVGAELTDVYTMGGNGTSTPIRDLRRLYEQHPELGDAAGWKKVSGTARAANFHYVVHWYENGGVVPANEIKLKGVGRE